MTYRPVQTHVNSVKNDILDTDPEYDVITKENTYFKTAGKPGDRPVHT
ncbi:hypothetical protein [Gracilimonas amylolytica]|nr:hypothetical protein [Gracilimonas amylolytica]